MPTPDPDLAGPSESPTPAAPATPTRPGTERSGLTLGVSAYLWWGLLPLYFPLMAPAASIEIIAHRVIWSLVLCLVILVATRSWRSFTTLLRDRSTMLTLTAASVLLAINWLVFVIGVTTGHTVDAALGYFINPLVTVGLAVGLLHERLRTAQWVAIGLGTAAVVVITVGYGRLPWIGLTLAASFGGYGLLKKRVAGRVAAAPGLAAETLVLAPVALGYLGWLSAHGADTFANHGAGHALLLISLGVGTTVPLLAFNAATRRLPLSMVGILQYITPVMQFLIGVLVQHDTMSPARWWGFVLVWAAVVVVAVDGVRHAGTAARRARADRTV